jgi:two-component system cell cycle sensor histidine kinase/response regulator CckA
MTSPRGSLQRLRPRRTRDPRDASSPEEVVDRLLDRLLWIGSTLGLLATVASLNRWLWRGWHPQHALHLGVYLLLLFGLVVGRRLPRPARVACILAPLWANGVGNLVWQGLAGTGLLFLAVVCLLAALFLGRTVALVLLALSTLQVATIGALVVSGALPPPPDLAPRLSTTTEWVAQGAAFFALVAAGVLSATAIQGALLRATERLGARTRELEQENEVRRRTEAQLAEGEAKYRVLAENSRDVVFALDLDLNLTYLSPAAAALFGAPVRELVCQGVRALLTPTGAERVSMAFASGLSRAEHGERTWPLFELECTRADGSRFWGEVHATFVVDAEGKVVGAQGTLRDVSERKRMEREREVLQERLDQDERLRALGQLAGGIAHDFNNQLTGIVGYAELLRMELDPSGPPRAHAERILVGAQRAAELTAKLLAFARSGHRRSEPVDLHGILREVVALLERSIDKTVTLTLDLRAKRHVVLGDATLLQSALLNLGLNARDALPQGGPITFRTRDDPPGVTLTEASAPRVVVEVRDEGVGMSEEAQRRAFEPFFTTKPAGRGTGMGLAAVHGTVASHDGTVRLESSVGAGTTVTMTFPVVEDTTTVPAPSTARAPTGSAMLLVVDDERDALAATSMMLDHLGYRVTASRKPLAALAKFRERWREIDLVLLDLVLPELGGAALFAALRAIDPHARILLVTGYSADGVAQELLEQGAIGLLQKPFRLADLSREVTAALARPRGGSP